MHGERSPIDDCGRVEAALECRSYVPGGGACHPLRRLVGVARHMRRQNDVWQSEQRARSLRGLVFEHIEATFSVETVREGNKLWLVSQ